MSIKKLNQLKELERCALEIETKRVVTLYGEDDSDKSIFGAKPIREVCGHLIVNIIIPQC